MIRKKYVISTINFFVKILPDGDDIYCSLYVQDGAKTRRGGVNRIKIPKESKFFLPSACGLCNAITDTNLPMRLVVMLPCKRDTRDVFLLAYDVPNCTISLSEINGEPRSSSLPECYNA